MAITRLKRKGRKNKLTSKRRIQKLALEGSQPVIKNVDVEAIKAEFKAATAKPAKAEKKEAAPAKAKAVKKAPAKKATPKKETAPKAEKKTPAKKKEE